MKIAVLMLGLVLGAAEASAANQTEEYCAFEVEVMSPTGLPAPGVVVIGDDAAGFQFGGATTNEQGVARLCDSPRGLAEITVGGRMCGAVTVKYLNSIWPRTRHVVVTYQRCQGDDYYLPGACELTLRLVDQGRSAVSGATLRIDSVGAQTGESMLVSDQYGRIFARMKRGERLCGVLSKAGFAPQHFSQDCKPGEGFRPDRTLKLDPLLGPR